MRIALCFSGQPRFVNEAAAYIKNCIYNNYDVDVFAHLWFDEDLTNKPYKYGGAGGWENQRISKTAIEDFVKLYDPKVISTEKSMSFQDDNIQTKICHYDNGDIIKWTKHWEESTEPNYRNRMINNWISNFYSLLQVNIIRKAYEHKHNFKYDFVIKCRTDCFLQTKINFKEYDINKLHYTNILNQPDGMIADYLVFGGPKVIDGFMCTYSILDLVLDICYKKFNNAWSNEMLHRVTLDLLGIQYESHPIIVSLPRF